ncbi:nucleotidyltransferase family protein [candidate division KSB1 bacterium]
MRDLPDILSILKENKNRLKKKYHLKSIEIFGSMARQDFTKESDIDILVDFEKPIGIEFIDLANELEELLNQKVDLVSKRGIKPKYYKAIEKDLTCV